MDGPTAPSTPGLPLSPGAAWPRAPGDPVKQTGSSDRPYLVPGSAAPRGLRGPCAALCAPPGAHLRTSRVCCVQRRAGDLGWRPR